MRTLQHWMRVLALACTFCAAFPQFAVRSQVVISQVFGGGGNSGAPLKNDFIELFNQGQAPVPLEGWAVEYASASGSSWQSAVLSGIIEPHGWFLICLPGGTAGGSPLPAVDDSGSFGMSATAGKVALLDSAQQLSGTCPSSSHIRDFIGWGSASCFKGSGAAPGTSNTTAAVRKDSGMASSGDNAADFVAASPSPRNTATVPLAVQLSLLQAVEIRGGGVRLTWQTQSELNNYGFFVQKKRSADSAFLEITSSFQEGSGTTLEQHNYAYVDTAGNSTCTYRLKQVDLNGAFRLSEIVGVTPLSSVSSNLVQQPLRLQVYPNPFNPKTVVSGQWSVTGVVRLVVYDILGRQVAVLAHGSYPAGIYTFTFDGTRLSSGIYICRLTAGNSTAVRKLTLMK